MFSYRPYLKINGKIPFTSIQELAEITFLSKSDLLRFIKDEIDIQLPRQSSKTLSKQVKKFLQKHNLSYVFKIDHYDDIGGFGDFWDILYYDANTNKTISVTTCYGSENPFNLTTTKSDLDNYLIGGEISRTSDKFKFEILTSNHSILEWKSGLKI